jgi:tetratricopeptide (TPR) repeat protein
MALAESKLGILDRLSGREQVLLKNAGAVRDLGVARREGRHADALAIYDRLPKALQEDPFVMRQAVFAAMEVDKERYRREMERYIRTFPDDPAAGVMALDVHFMAKEWEAASAAIDAIERFVGTDDGWMAILRGSVASSSGDADGAKRFFAEGFRREPALRAFLAKKKGR